MPPLTLGLILDNVFEEYWQKLWLGTAAQARKREVNLICYTGSTPLSSRAEVYKLISRDHLDGLLLGSVFHHLSEEQRQEFLGRFSGLPCLSLNHQQEGLPCVIVDNRSGLQTLLSHLIRDHGARRIAFLGGPRRNSDAQERLLVYRQVLTDFDIPVDEALIVEGQYLRQDGERAVRQLMDERKVAFDALVAANDLMAIYAIRALKARGLRIPEDVLVTGFDNISESRFINPPLTTIDQPLMEMGRRALDLILELIGGREIPLKNVLPAEVQLRRSCGCFLHDGFRKTHLLLQPRRPLWKNRQKGSSLNRQTFLENLAGLTEIFSLVLDASLCQAWITTLAQALVDGIEEKNENQFMEKLEPVFLEGFQHNVDLGTWERIVTELFLGATRNTADPAEKGWITSLYQEVLLLIASLQDFQRTSYHLTIHTESTLLQLFTMRLSDRYLLSDIKEYLDDYLPRLDLHTCSIALYAGGSGYHDEAVTFYTYQADAVRTEANTAASFPSRQLVPWQRRADRQPFLYMVLPIARNREHYGFAVFEPQNLDSSVCEPIANQLSISLETARYFEKIKQHSRDLSLQVQERTRELEKEVQEKELAYNVLTNQKKEIERLYTELQKADEAKTHFFINLAHETKTPLTLIRNYLDDYMQQKPEDTRLQIVKQNFDKLLRDMINFLDEEKLQRGQLFYNHKQITDFSSLLSEKLDLFRVIAEKKPISLEADLSEGICIRIDPFALDRIINNLLDNAIKYTEVGGKITVRLEAAGQQTLLTVQDTGIGIPAQQLQTIFEPYYQLSHQKRNIQGIGMGLSIVKKILDSLGAKIEVESAVGEGTCFKITFSRCRAGRGDKPGKPVRSLLPLDQQPLVSRLQDSHVQEEKENIFLVDDNREMLFLLQNALQDNYNIFLAENGSEALEKLGQIPPPDLIISDIMMDRMDGFSFLSELSREEAYKHIPFIFLTAKSTAEAKFRGLAHGAVDYIAKPFSVEELKLKIEAILRNRRLLQKDNVRQFKKKLAGFIDTMNLGEAADNRLSSIEAVCRQYNFTKREKEVLLLLSEGLLNKEISAQLNISIKTTERHIHNIFAKCHVQNRVELMNLLLSSP